MKTYLKVKIASLAAEAKIIRAMEKKYRRSAEGSTRRRIFWGLRDHRTSDVRREARSAQLAYGFLRGRTYRQIERECYSPPDWKRVEALVVKYGGGSPADVKQKLQIWMDQKETDGSAAIAA